LLRELKTGAREALEGFSHTVISLTTVATL
jgi:hypothetical protein